jgi:hypothetical protein
MDICVWDCPYYTATEEVGVHSLLLYYFVCLAGFFGILKSCVVIAILYKKTLACNDRKK